MAPTAALAVIAGCVPLHIQARCAHENALYVKGDRIDKVVKPNERLPNHVYGWVPTGEARDGEIRYNTDAALVSDGREAGLEVVRSYSIQIKTEMFKVAEKVDNNIAVMLAVQSGEMHGRCGRGLRHCDHGLGVSSE